ncbi:hypothetical protein [Clostridium sulfidigenes]|uniref:hypothetical protein n=1 Tax=Clostridium sulfidigenes TaxID=318464 RepID=UPI003F8C8C06
MFEYIKASNIGKDGIEYIGATVNPYWLDDYGLGNGKLIVLTNNHIKNTYEIEEFRHVHGCPQFVNSIKKGKDEIKTVGEFKMWLINNGYSDEDFIKGIKEVYPDTYEKYYKF